jgi:hypothetical protein
VRAGDALEAGVAADEIEEVDALFEGYCVDRHAARLRSGI